MVSKREMDSGGLPPEKDVESEAGDHAEDGSCFGCRAGKRSEKKDAQHCAVCDRCDGESDLDDMAAAAGDDREHEESDGPEEG